jgi:hypothetical protein
MKTANIQEFHKKFVEEYDFLYDNHDNVAGFDEAVDAFDTMIKNDSFKEFVGEFARYRNDYITSDREAAAFMFTMESFGMLN